MQPSSTRASVAPTTRQQDDRQSCPGRSDRGNAVAAIQTRQDFFHSNTKGSRLVPGIAEESCLRYYYTNQRLWSAASGRRAEGRTSLTNVPLGQQPVPR